MITFAEKVRQGAKSLKEFNSGELSDAVKVKSYKERRAVQFCIRNLVQQGELKRIAPGRYKYVGRMRPQTLKERLWDISRRMIRFNLDDLQQITEASRDAVKHFCSWLVREGYIERVKPGHFKVVKYMGPSVPNGKKTGG